MKCISALWFKMYFIPHWTDETDSFEMSNREYLISKVAVTLQTFSSCLASLTDVSVICPL
jgi:hypothetical protein